MNLPFLTSRNVPIPNARDTRKYVLLTGATGLLGQYLLKELLLAGVRVAVLVRSSKYLDPQARVEAILQRWENELKTLLPRPVVLCGEVTRTSLGLSPTERAWADSHCDAILHNAAVVSFEETERTQEPWTTNLQGTQNILRFAAEADIREIHYVSTAFVCGDREGLVREDELDCGQGFRNAYEHSKFQAELLVRQQTDPRRRTIYRPSVIAGDAVTGFTSSYHGLMLYLRLLDLLVPQQPKNEAGQHVTPIELPVNGDEPHDVVTVDFVARGIAALFCNPRAQGRTYHLCAEEPTIFRDVIDWCCRFYNSSGVVYRGAGAAPTPNSPFAEMFFEQSRVYHRYNRGAIRFDAANFRKFLPNLASPKIDEAMVRRFIEFGRKDRWGKRRVQRPNYVRLSDQELTRWLLRSAGCGGELDREPVGISCRGPGGGQWTARRDDHGNLQIQTGFALDAHKICDCSVKQILEAQKGGGISEKTLFAKA